jgi:aspartate-semialdehyde dehydrogenase
VIDVGVLGATGLVGQHLVARLERHPWFRVVWLAASERSSGRRYGDLAWRAEAAQPERVARLTVETARPGGAPALIFSALDAAAADDLEPAFAARGHVVISNARSHRMREDVPLVVPEINGDTIARAAAQPWPGAIVTNPNCSTIFLALALAPLARFGLTAVTVSTLQALSGAGFPGVASLDAIGNVVPHIAGEEEKIETETLKILGARFPISAQATRVPVAHGHTELVSVRLESRVTAAALLEAWAGFRGAGVAADLPSAPAPPIHVVDGADRPQPRLDANRGDGMAVSVGRVRPCPVLGWRFVALGHNLIRGAAGAAILNAELARATGFIDATGARSTVRAGDIVSA